MRISDWSSDLCSSDLQAAVGGQRRGAVRAEAEDVGKQRAQGGIDGGGGRISHEHILQPRPSAERANALNAGPHAAMRDGLKASICHSGSCRFIQSRLRSEEHTSELQSLMRISYAVFCLNKKPTATQVHYRQVDRLVRLRIFNVILT